ncbi:hypothetical protein FACS1894187_13360 [Synergistales bacterium]|nr:hypothetical protein FACS1894187_13360 [Synergistales bacterium]
MLLIMLIFATMFFFGLYAWAQSGAALWELRDVKKKQAARTSPAARSAQVFLEMDKMDEVDTTRTGLKNGDGAKNNETKGKDPLLVIHELETNFDRVLKSSVKILGALIICVWGFAILTFVLDAFNVDWMSRVSWSAMRFWETSASGTVYNAQSKDTLARQNIFLRGLNWNR